jgi:chemotaxis protein methyltransferase CheR
MIAPTEREFLAELCLVRAGFKVDPEKSYLIDSRLAPIARREGFGSLADFVQAVRVRGEERLVWAAVEAMAMGETGFFRDPAVFDTLAAEVLPELARARGGAPVRVWSAGCAAGQEIHSLAMLLAEQPEVPPKVELFASDISEHGLEKAQAGLYSQFEVQRGLPARQLVRHFEKRGDLFALTPRVRQMTRWRRVNLMDSFADLGQFDLILCRNVLSGLAAFAQARVLEGLAAALAPGGRLVLGRGETAGALQALLPDAAIFAGPGAGVRSAA